MSEGQKKRRYGASAVPSGGEGNRTPGTAGRSRGSAQPTGRSSTRTPVAPGTYRREDLAPRPGSGSSLGIIIGVLTTIAVLLFCYVTFLVLPGIGRAYGLTLPELRITGFDREQIAAAASALGDQGREDYRWVHRSSGLLMPLFMALVGWGAEAASRRRPASSTVYALSRKWVSPRPDRYSYSAAVSPARSAIRIRSPAGE